MRVKTRWIADAIIGVLASTSHIWVDVTIFHRILIGIFVAAAVQTLFVWLDNKFEDEENIGILERKEENRAKIYEFWRKEMP